MEDRGVIESRREHRHLNRLMELLIHLDSVEIQLPDQRLISVQRDSPFGLHVGSLRSGLALRFLGITTGLKPPQYASIHTRCQAHTQRNNPSVVRFRHPPASGGIKGGVTAHQPPVAHPDA